MNAKKLQISHLDRKLMPLYQFGRDHMPNQGWIRTIRQALNMSQKQIGQKLGISRQGVQLLEKREGEGGITLNSLREVAGAMDMELVYAFIPKDGSLENLVERKARMLARSIVQRTSQSMSLEDQKVSDQRLNESINDLTNAFVRELPKTLWD